MRSFPGAKTDDTFYYLVPSLEKNPDYVILHVGTIDVFDHQSSEIISKLFKLKGFIQLKVTSCKVIISTPIKRYDNKKESSVVDDVIQQLQQLNTETIINANIEENMLGKKGLHLNRNGLKQFAKNLIDAVRELWKLEKPFCDLTQNDPNKLIKNQISSNSRVTFIEENNILNNFTDVNCNWNIFTESKKLENSE